MYDQDTVAYNENLPIAEKIVGHHWNFILEKPPLNPAKKTLYDYSPKLEGDMIDSKASLSLSEDMLSHPYAAWMTKKWYKWDLFASSLNKVFKMEINKKIK